MKSLWKTANTQAFKLLYTCYPSLLLEATTHQFSQNAHLVLFLWNKGRRERHAQWGPVYLGSHPRPFTGPCTNLWHRHSSTLRNALLSTSPSSGNCFGGPLTECLQRKRKGEFKKMNPNETLILKFFESRLFLRQLFLSYKNEFNLQGNWGLRGGALCLNVKHTQSKRTPDVYLAFTTVSKITVRLQVT